jgi:hypothetical protein
MASLGIVAIPNTGYLTATKPNIALLDKTKNIAALYKNSAASTGVIIFQ